MITIPLPPHPKPRMTRADKWKKRKCVVSYRQWCDRLRGLMGDRQLPEAYEIVFHVPMPPSWSQKKRAAMVGTPHQQRPDLDNYIKSVGDALCDEDSHFWQIHATKLWAEEGKIVIRPLHTPQCPTG